MDQYEIVVVGSQSILPQGWGSRLVNIQNENTDLKIGYCLEPHDLAASKLAAGRDKDWPFVETMLRYLLADPALLRKRTTSLPILEGHKARLLAWLDFRSPG